MFLLCLPFWNDAEDSYLLLTSTEGSQGRQPTNIKYLIISKLAFLCGEDRERKEGDTVNRFIFAEGILLKLVSFSLWSRHRNYHLL